MCLVVSLVLVRCDVQKLQYQQTPYSLSNMFATLLMAERHEKSLLCKLDTCRQTIQKHFWHDRSSDPKYVCNLFRFSLPVSQYKVIWFFSETIYKRRSIEILLHFFNLISSKLDPNQYNHYLIYNGLISFFDSFMWKSFTKFFGMAGMALEIRANSQSTLYLHPLVRIFSLAFTIGFSPIALMLPWCSDDAHFFPLLFSRFQYCMFHFFPFDYVSHRGSFGKLFCFTHTLLQRHAVDRWSASLQNKNFRLSNYLLRILQIFRWTKRCCQLRCGVNRLS